MIVSDDLLPLEFAQHFENVRVIFLQFHLKNTVISVFKEAAVCVFNKQHSVPV
jgi:hypothetical protein